MAKQRRDRRTFTEQFKKDLVQQIENGARVSDLAKEHGIQPSQISLWKRKIPGKPGKRGRKPGSTNRATAASGSGASTPTTTESTAGTAKKATRKRAGRKRGSSKKSSAASAPSAAAPRTTSRASSSGSSNQADVERMIGRLVLENQRLRDQLEGGD